jgi:prepilin-type N-terminal cleavage/methylation domain-containing protein/prepilin-type processing-associated H-X9-DG protein
MKTIPGRISFPRRGFTLIELLVVIGIIAVLAGIALPVINSVQRRTRATVEANSARQIVAGYLAYAADNDGELLPGYLAGASVEFPNGDIGAGPEAERYPWRLAPYLQWNADIYMINDLQKTVANMDRGSTEYRYMVSLAPALGLNTYCVGGYQTATSTLAKNDVALRLGSIDRSLVAFVSARTKTSAKSGAQSGDIAGSFFVRPPIFGGAKWKTGDFDEKKASLDYGNVDFRHSGKTVAAFTDGSVRMMDIDELRDMRLWARNADSPSYSVKP